MDIVKAILLASTAELLVTAMVPPKRAIEGQTPIYRGQLFEFLVRYLAYLGCFLVSTSALCHSILILYRDEESWAAPLVPWLCPRNPPSIDSIVQLSPRFIVGVVLVIAGTLIRVWTYRALGSLFTFEVVIKNDHRLITNGPYKIVRHPAYTGMVMLLLGTHLIHFGEAGYVTFCDFDATPMVIFVNIWRVGAVFTGLSLCRRCDVEDKQLHERFEAGWDAYQKAVPYAMIPFVF
ncbi:hypothetical protein C8Q79DRAFT_998762 [Trametes meyenii]|nr:hypothetical protein C8Q79DRAFT_998762 [Trametes meyenii]